jgi:hypothetical protein
MGPLRGRVAEIFEHFLEASFSFTWYIFLNGTVGVNLQQLHFFVNVIHGFLHVALFPIGWKIQWLEWRKGSHKFFIGERLGISAADLPAHCFEFVL